MRYKYVSMFGLVLLLILFKITIAEERQAGADTDGIETFIMEAIELTNVSIWVAADKAGPVINRSCGTRYNQLYSLALPVSVCHTKTNFCPEAVGRLLAEYISVCYEGKLPLTIFNVALR